MDACEPFKPAHTRSYGCLCTFSGRWHAAGYALLRGGRRCCAALRGEPPEPSRGATTAQALGDVGRARRDDDVLWCPTTPDKALNDHGFGGRTM